MERNEDTMLAVHLAWCLRFFPLIGLITAELLAAAPTMPAKISAWRQGL